MKAPELYGLVLIGGESSRMGEDKSRIRYHAKDQRLHSYDLLGRHCSKVFLSCNPRQARDLSLPHIIDNSICPGPLAGILSAMKQHPHNAWLVLACDMPFVTDIVLQKLKESRNAHKAATCFYHHFPEPLCTIWEPVIYPALETYAHSGGHSPRKFLEQVETQKIPIALHSKDLMNFNTPEEKKKFHNHQ